MTRPALTPQAPSQPAGRTVGIPHQTVPSSGPAAVPTARRADVDAGRWPDVARLPSAGSARTAVARHFVGRALDRLSLTVPAARARAAAPGPRLTLHDSDAFYQRIGRDGLIGFGESYMAGEWDSDDLAGVLTVLAAHADELVPAPLRRLRG
ncbi:SAM-dependent methyltransferase, partial [Streptomyces sp. NPDC002262]